MQALHIITLTEDCLRRGSFPFERIFPGAGFSYNNQINTLKQKMHCHRFMAVRIQELEQQLPSNPQNIDKPQKHEWVPILEDLIFPPETIRPEISSIVGMIDKSTTAFAACFRNILLNFLNQIVPSTSGLIEEESYKIFYHNIAKWYLKAVLDTAKYVLYTRYSQSNMPYSEWSGLFQESLSNDHIWVSIAEEYPVLIRYLSVTTKNYMAAFLEMIQRLNADRSDLESELNISRSALLTKIEMGLSDPHRGGRTVVCLSFTDSNNVIYKPKNMNIDHAFHAFIEKNKTQLSMCPLKIIVKHNYGWAEYLGNAGSTEGIGKNPEAIGKAAACFWLLNSTDMHNENLTSKQNGIFPLDIETLLCPTNVKDVPALDPPWRRHSIFSTLLFQFSQGEGTRQDMSGFNPDQNVSYEAEQILFEIEDDKVVFKKVSAPKRTGISGGSNYYYDDQASTVLMEAFSELCDSDLVQKLSKFVGGLNSKYVIRIVFRNTFLYFRILEKVRQPRFMRDAALLYMDLMSLHSAVSAENPFQETLHQLIDNEIIQLINADIPYFSSKVDGFDLNLSDKKIKSFFLTSGKDNALQKLKNFEKNDIEEQKTLINLALNRKTNSKILFKTEEKEHAIQAYLDKYIYVTIQSGFSPKDRPTRWLSIFGDISGRDNMAHIGNEDFFSGTWGILLALEAAHSTSQQKEIDSFLDLEANKWQACYDKIDYEDTFRNHAPLGIAGVGGDFFAHANLIKLDKERWGFLEDALSKKLHTLEEKIAQDTAIDVIGGSAGLILGCEQFLRQQGAERLHEKLYDLQWKAALQLLKTATEIDGSLAWIIPKEKKPLLSYAHGWAGIVTALHYVLKRTKNFHLKNQLEECLQKSAKFPDVLLKQDGGWYDHRTLFKEPTELNVSWCHGSSGILRGLYETRDYCSSRVVQKANETIEVLVNKSEKDDVHRYCCGEFGRLDFTMDYQATMDDEQSKKSKDKLISRIKDIVFDIASPERNTPSELCVPSLFHGFSGIAYTLARLSNTKLPSLSGQMFDTNH